MTFSLFKKEYKQQEVFIEGYNKLLSRINSLSRFERPIFFKKAYQKMTEKGVCGADEQIG